MATVGERASSVLAAEGPETKKGGGPGRLRPRTGMHVPRVFSREGSSPFDEVEWDLRTAEIKDERGRAIFQQVNCEVPRSWSQLATNVVASKYFYGDVASGNGSPADGQREYSVRQLVNRVTRTIADWGKEDRYFASDEDAERFYDELTTLCLNQYGSFNSPVWFNVGLFHRYGITGPANNYRWDEETRADAGRQRLPVSAGLGVLHPECQRRHGRHHAAGDQRGDALQVRLGDRHRPLHAPLQPGEALRRRQAVGAGQLHAGV